MINLIGKKEQIRKQALKRRKELSETMRIAYSRKIAGQLLKHPLFLCAEEIYCYVPYREEVLTWEIIQTAWKCGKKVAVPKVLGDQDMEFYYIRSVEELSSGYCNISEPSGNPEDVAQGKNALVILPGAVFDTMGNRIGYGKGFYDSYLKKHPEYHRVGIAFSVQCIELIPVEEHDIPAEFVFTERGILCQDNYQKIL